MSVVRRNGHRAGDLDALLAHVLEGDPFKRFACEGCGEEAEVWRSIGKGRVPAYCEGCRPMSRMWDREREVRPLYELVRRLAARVELLEGRLRAKQRELLEAERANAIVVTARRAVPFGRPGAAALAAAVRAAAAAEGREGKREALLDVAAVAHVWARLLEPGCDD